MERQQNVKEETHVFDSMHECLLVENCGGKFGDHLSRRGEIT